MSTTDSPKIVSRLYDIDELNSRTRKSTAVPDPDLSVHPQHRTPGGMGIHLMRLSTDSLVHRPRPGGGNILTLTRSRVRRPKEE